MSNYTKDYGHKDYGHKDYGYQAFRLLQIAFVIAPIIIGLDKFFYFLTNWSQYVAPEVSSAMQGKLHAAMIAIGIIEIIVGIGVIFKPKIFAYIVAIWFAIVIINLLLTGHFFDIAIRDFGLLLAALALGRLAQKYENNPAKHVT